MAGNLRSFRRADADAVVELSRRALARPDEQVGNPLWTSREELESELADWEPPAEDLLLVDEEDGRIAAFGGIEVRGGFAHADLFGPLVAPDARGHKLGTRMLEASLERARAHGAQDVLAAVGAKNAAGRLVLEHAGFHAVDTADAILRLRPSDHRPAERPPDGLSSRPARPDDLDAVLALYRESFPEGVFPAAVWAAGLERGSVHLAEEAGAPVAFVHIDPQDRWVYHLGVSEDERGRGVGSYVLSRALAEYWRERPADVLGLSVRADNVPALRLYRAQGFAPWLVLRRFELSL